eukprot:CAMPEP_0119129766 /NCGR_PEP_ID=MMETSP1310-20130426/7372_1 /TAXON_ID=464262 /ORGANISM="Genus nov. species nov., Strain RCC2339" /LENGTH=300 /DNA_ID=CAMNT_0007120209 /DNA_START=1 /DNA_END=903 /DNA_ORIENTATION=+
MSIEMAGKLRVVGFIGYGTIAEAIVDGICGRGVQQRLKFVEQIHISRRSATRSERAQRMYSCVTVHEHNQTIVDRVREGQGTLFLSVLPAQLMEVLGQLEGLRQVPVVATVVSSVPAHAVASRLGIEECVKAVPMPPVSRREGATVMIRESAPDEPVYTLFSHLGSVVRVKDEQEMRPLQSVTCMAGTLYGFLETQRKWVLENSSHLDADDATKFLIDLNVGLLQDLQTLFPDHRAHTMRHVIQEQTPGGFNERALAHNQPALEMIRHSLNDAHTRFQNSDVPPATPLSCAPPSAAGPDL